MKLSSKDEVNRILKNWKKFPEGIQITADYTFQQRTLYKKLKKEALKYNLEHPNNLKSVKYVNGNPTLMDNKKSGNLSNNFRPQE